MNVQCPSCETIYRIDPARVPSEGIRARCAVCSFAIHLTHEGGAPAEPAAASVPDEGVVETPPAPDEPVFIEPEPAEESTAPAPPVVDEAPAIVAEPETTQPEPAPEPVAEIAPEHVAEAAPEPVAEAAPEPVAESEAPPAEVPPVRLSRPFVAPEDAPAPAQPQVTRPTAPVFKPTPGAPVQDAPIPPAEPVAEAPAAPAVPEAPRDTTPLPDAVAQTAPPPLAQEPPPVVETPPVPEPAAPVAPAAEAPPAVEPPAGPAKPVNPFLQRDPKQKARRLARALISDMIVYQPQKRQETLENGTLKEAFDEEIKKSWEEYVEQVGEDMANSTDFFKEALNEILAGGQEIF